MTILIILKKKKKKLIDSFASESSDHGRHLPSEKLPGLHSSPDLSRITFRQELYKNYMRGWPFQWHKSGTLGLT